MNNETNTNNNPLNASREQLAALALPQLRASMEQLIANEPAKVNTETSALDVGVGAMYLSHGVFMGIAKGDFAFTSGVSLRFEGQQWGPGIAVGFSAGQITTVPGVAARELLGEIQYDLAQKPGI
ncbi:MAG TPA: hypothetical protein ENJ18_17085, partial [Nannocystis exedens]|nr:hypothetical protein [Nannocystis exedens]